MRRSPVCTAPSAQLSGKWRRRWLAAADALAAAEAEQEGAPSLAKAILTLLHDARGPDARRPLRLSN